jgi:hypothetical protein
MATIKDLRKELGDARGDFDEALQGLIDKGLAVRVGDYVRVTVKGRRTFEELSHDPPTET